MLFLEKFPVKPPSTGDRWVNYISDPRALLWLIRKKVKKYFRVIPRQERLRYRIFLQITDRYQCDWLIWLLINWCLLIETSRAKIPGNRPSAPCYRQVVLWLGSVHIIITRLRVGRLTGWRPTAEPGLRRPSHRWHWFLPSSSFTLHTGGAAERVYKTLWRSRSAVSRSDFNVNGAVYKTVVERLLFNERFD